MWNAFQQYVCSTKSTGTCNKYMIIIIIIGERAKQARHSQVCSIKNRDIYVS